MLNPPLQKSMRIDWNKLNVVLAVARAKTIKKAAISLGVTEATVSRHIAAIEESLGSTLFVRTPAGMHITPAGERLMDYLSRAEMQLEAGIIAAGNDQSVERGKVRVTAVPTLVNHLLIPASNHFLKEHPNIELEMIGLPTDLSMMHREADIAVRLARPSVELDTITRRIGHLEYSVYANLAQGSGCEDAAHLPWITYESDMSSLPQNIWIDGQIQNGNGELSRLRCNDADGLLEATRSNLGKTLLPRLVGEKYPDLCEIKGYQDLPVRELWLIVHPNVLTSARVRVVVDWLASILPE